MSQTITPVIKTVRLKQANRNSFLEWLQPTTGQIMALAGFSGLCFIIHFLFFRHSFPPVNVDEASFYSPAFNFAQHGTLASPVHQNFLPGAAKHTYWMPPFYMVVLGIWLKLTGGSIVSGKLLSAIFVALAAWMLSKLSTGMYAKAWTIALFLICPFVLLSSAFIRMEAMGLCLIALSLWLVKIRASSILLGIVAGICVCTHPVLYACAAALGVAVITRGWRHFISFSLAALITLSPYLIYILQDSSGFSTQMELQFLRKSTRGFKTLNAMYLLQALPFALASLWLSLKMNCDKAFRLFILIALSITLLIVLQSNEFNYMVYTMPYCIAVVATLLSDRKQAPVFKSLLPMAALLFFGAVLCMKLVKYHFQTDRSYKDVTSYLSTRTDLQKKRIYVGGSPDVAAFLIMSGVEAQRDIPIQTNKPKTWIEDFDYVIETHNGDQVELRTDSSGSSPWLLWKNRSVYISSDRMAAIEIFSR